MEPYLQLVVLRLELVARPDTLLVALLVVLLLVLLELVRLVVVFCILRFSIVISPPDTHSICNFFAHYTRGKIYE